MKTQQCELAAAYDPAVRSVYTDIPACNADFAKKNAAMFTYRAEYGKI